MPVPLGRLVLASPAEKTPLALASALQGARLPTMFLISSRPQLPASRSLPSAQFRKGRRQGKNPFIPMEFSKSRARFRAWALGTDQEAGAWGPDTGRNFSGTLEVTRGTSGYGATSGCVSADNAYQAYGGGGSTAMWGYRASISALKAYGDDHVGPNFAPAHVKQPLILYLGRPA